MTDLFSYPRVRLQYREKNGQLWKVLIEDRDGSVIDLPAQHVEAEYGANQPGTVSLRVSAHRVRFEQLSEADCGY